VCAASAPGGTDGVVVAAEPVQLPLEFLHGGGGWLRGEPLLLGLVEALDLAAGLRVVGPGVVEEDPSLAELDLEGDPAAASGCAGEDRAVVGEHPAGMP
jgi:hypothetical protein